MYDRTYTIKVAGQFAAIHFLTYQIAEYPAEIFVPWKR
jgi:hypothetical protein